MKKNVQNQIHKHQIHPCQNNAARMYAKFARGNVKMGVGDYVL